MFMAEVVVAGQSRKTARQLNGFQGTPHPAASLQNVPCDCVGAAVVCVENKTKDQPATQAKNSETVSGNQKRLACRRWRRHRPSRRRCRGASQPASERAGLHGSSHTPSLEIGMAR